MIRLSSRRTRRALDHIQPTHLAGIGITPLGEIARIACLTRKSGGEKADTRSLQSLLNIQRPANRIQKIAPGANIAQVGDCLRAVRIVQPQDRSLRKDVRSAQARRMLRIAFDFCRTVEMTLNQYRT